MPKVSLFAGEDIGLKPAFRPGDGAGGSSPKRRRLALPAAGELYLSCTDSGEGGTSGRGEEQTKNLTLSYKNNLKTRPA